MHSRFRTGHYSGRSPFKNYDSSYYSNRTQGSGMTAHSEHLRKLMDDDTDLYPTGFAELLRGEERNLRTFKNQISR